MTATILVVDDLEPNVKLLEAKLLGEYYTVLTTNSGASAIEILAKERVDIILLDVMMPGMDGFETCKVIKSNASTLHIPVVMVTALSDIEDRVKALEAGADEFLTKPVNDVALFARVKSLSRIRTVIDELRMRNKTNAELGGKVVDFTDNFTDNKILIISDDVIQSKNMTKIISKITSHTQTITNIDNLDDVIASSIPDMVIINCQIEFTDPLRIVAKLRGISTIKQSAIMLLAEEENISIVIKGLEIGANDYFIYPVDENELLARIKTQLRRKKYQDELRQDLEETVNLSIKDGLTGIFNRRYFDTHIEQIIEQANKNKQPFCLIMIDMDHFKAVNDGYGHQAGDTVLKILANAIQNTIRATDLFARYGGEEFVIVLHDSDTTQATIITERIRKIIEDLEFKISDTQSLRKTLSIGLAEYAYGESSKSLIEHSDNALYEAKESGRNRVVTYKAK